MYQFNKKIINFVVITMLYLLEEHVISKMIEGTTTDFLATNRAFYDNVMCIFHLHIYSNMHLLPPFMLIGPHLSEEDPSAPNF